ncbi:hypothetical protein BDD12DRAFT_810356 [Trichophaea hybrida]|nr:hypothetical protein BDD12DRAFT_810356 [Trichophaea hybrida]
MDAFYTEIFNYSGVCIGHRNAFPALHSYHHQRLLDEEILVLTHLLYPDPIEDTNFLQELSVGTFFPWMRCLLREIPNPEGQPDHKVIEELMEDDALPLTLINKDLKLAMDPFSPQALAEFVEYLLNDGLEGSVPRNDAKKRQKIITLECYKENIQSITTHCKASNIEENGRHHRARSHFRVQNRSLCSHNPNGQDGLRVATPLTAFDFIVGCYKA